MHNRYTFPLWNVAKSPRTEAGLGKLNSLPTCHSVFLFLLVVLPADGQVPASVHPVHAKYICIHIYEAIAGDQYDICSSCSANSLKRPTKALIRLGGMRIPIFVLTEDVCVVTGHPFEARATYRPPETYLNHWGEPQTRFDLIRRMFQRPWINGCSNDFANAEKTWRLRGERRRTRGDSMENTWRLHGEQVDNPKRTREEPKENSEKNARRIQGEHVKSLRRTEENAWRIKGEHAKNPRKTREESRENGGDHVESLRITRGDSKEDEEEHVETPKRMRGDSEENGGEHMNSPRRTCGESEKNEGERMESLRRMKEGECFSCLELKPNSLENILSPLSE